jgi:hypothetical protein
MRRFGIRLRFSFPLFDPYCDRFAKGNYFVPLAAAAEVMSARRYSTVCVIPVSRRPIYAIRQLMYTNRVSKIRGLVSNTR